MAGTDLVKSKSSRPLAVYDRPLRGPVLAALVTSRRLPAVDRDVCYRDSPDLVPIATRRRAEWLPYLAEADAATCTLYEALTTSIEPDAAAGMLGRVYAGLGIPKQKRAMLEAALDLIFGDDIARATGWLLRTPDGEGDVFWRPIEATPATVALGCRMLLARQVFEPKPAEIRKAFIDARDELETAQGRAAALCDQVIAVDRILLQHAHDEWNRPYLTEQYRPLLDRVLTLHGYAAQRDSDEWDEDQPSEFEKLIRQERAKLKQAIPPPETTTLPLERPRRRRGDGKRGRRRAIEPPPAKEGDQLGSSSID